ncbi:MAG TPA: hypothetical protein VHD62_17160 [Opitutaceae bacterium]|nr:hypothetical protein [Opitutaceae bacterium]
MASRRSKKPLAERDPAVLSGSLILGALGVLFVVGVGLIVVALL